MTWGRILIPISGGKCYFRSSWLSLHDWPMNFGPLSAPKNNCSSCWSSPGSISIGFPGWKASPRTNARAWYGYQGASPMNPEFSWWQSIDYADGVWHWWRFACFLKGSPCAPRSHDCFVNCNCFCFVNCNSGNDASWNAATPQSWFLCWSFWPVTLGTTTHDWPINWQ